MRHLTTHQIVNLKHFRVALLLKRVCSALFFLLGGRHLDLVHKSLAAVYAVFCLLNGCQDLVEVRVGVILLLLSWFGVFYLAILVVELLGPGGSSSAIMTKCGHHGLIWLHFFLFDIKCKLKLNIIIISAAQIINITFAHWFLIPIYCSVDVPSHANSTNKVSRLFYF